MNTIVYNDDNWLFPNQPLKTHDISYDDIQYLLNCADIDDHWAEDVQKWCKIEMNTQKKEEIL